MIKTEDTQRALEEPLDEDGRGESWGSGSQLEMDMLLAFEEQENLLSGTAPSSTRFHRHSAKPPHPQFDQEHEQGKTSRKDQNNDNSKSLKPAEPHRPSLTGSYTSNLQHSNEHPATISLVQQQHEDRGEGKLRDGYNNGNSGRSCSRSGDYKDNQDGDNQDSDESKGLQPTKQSSSCNPATRRSHKRRLQYVDKSILAIKSTQNRNQAIGEEKEQEAYDSDSVYGDFGYS